MDRRRKGTNEIMANSHPDRISEWIPRIHWPPVIKKGGECWHIAFNIHCENCKQVFNQWNNNKITEEEEENKRLDFIKVDKRDEKSR